MPDSPTRNVKSFNSCSMQDSLTPSAISTPDQTNIYSWWSYRFKAREKNAGWRIDYFLASASLSDKLKGAKIHTEIFGSDHCPVEVTVEI